MDDKAERSKAVSSQERDLLLHKTIEERKGKQIMLIIMTCNQQPQTLFCLRPNWILTKLFGNRYFLTKVQLSTFRYICNQCCSYSPHFRKCPFRDFRPFSANFPGYKWHFGYNINMVVGLAIRWFLVFTIT